MAELAAEYQFSSTTTEPPTGSQLRYNAAPASAATRIWVRDTTTPGADMHNLLMDIASTGIVYVQDYDDHTRYDLFLMAGGPVSKAGYVELPVAYYQSGQPLLTQKILLVTVEPAAQPQPPYTPTTYATVDELKPKVLQGNQTPDAYQTAEMQRCLDSASAEIDWWVPVNADYPAPAPASPGGQLIKQVCLARAVELYNEAWRGFGVVPVATDLSIVTSQETWRRHALTLMPVRQRFGVA